MLNACIHVDIDTPSLLAPKQAPNQAEEVVGEVHTPYRKIATTHARAATHPTTNKPGNDISKFSSHA